MLKCSNVFREKTFKSVKFDWNTTWGLIILIQFPHCNHMSMKNKNIMSQTALKLPKAARTIIFIQNYWIIFTMMVSFTGCSSCLLYSLDQWLQKTLCLIMHHKPASFTSVWHNKYITNKLVNQCIMTLHYFMCLSNLLRWLEISFIFSPYIIGLQRGL